MGMKLHNTMVQRRKGGVLADVAAVFMGPSGAVALALACCGVAIIAHEAYETRKHDAVIAAWGKSMMDSSTLRDAVASRPTSLSEIHPKRTNSR